MSFVRLDLAYDGTEFAGWATQPGERTVQEDLEGALEQVLGEEIATDRGRAHRRRRPRLGAGGELRAARQGAARGARAGP